MGNVPGRRRYQIGNYAHQEYQIGNVLNTHAHHLIESKIKTIYCMITISLDHRFYLIGFFVETTGARGFIQKA